MRGYAYVFLRKDGAPLPPGCAGHVGWAFALADGGFYCGSTENAQGRPFVPPGGDNGWWVSAAADERALCDHFLRRDYDGYKVATVRDCDPAKARATADALRDRGYAALRNNCLDHVHRVLRAYGDPGLPWPSTHPSPNDWFAAFNGEYRNLTGA